MDYIHIISAIELGNNSYSPVEIPIGSVWYIQEGDNFSPTLYKYGWRYRYDWENYFGIPMDQESYVISIPIGSIKNKIEMQ